MTKTERPRCPDCDEHDLVCPNCDDNRPTASDVDAGWRILSPFDRWETVARTEGGGFSRVLIWTEETGPDQPWWYFPWSKLHAIRPEWTPHGRAVIRVVEHRWPDSPMYAIACIDTNHDPDYVDPSGVIVQASTPGRGKGWTVSHRPGGEVAVVVCDSKAKARSELRRLARQYAKTMGVKLVLPPKEKP